MAAHITVALALCVTSLSAFADASLVVGMAISQSDDVKIQPTKDEVCPPNSICLQGWNRWTLDTTGTVSGPVVPNGRTYVVKMQHAPVADSTFKRQLLFVLEQIEDPAERIRLHADYKLLDIASPESMICTATDPSRFGVPQKDIYRREDRDSTTFCFRGPDAELQ